MTAPHCVHGTMQWQIDLKTAVLSYQTVKTGYIRSLDRKLQPYYCQCQHKYIQRKVTSFLQLTKHVDHGTMHCKVN